ncbi:MAG: DUF5028 domain-containing protein [Firmicutes bacterium]|nr:DUF5028 domain-containing protein [Bacillota bacterium]
MSRQMKKILLTGILVLLAAFWGLRFHAVNQNVPLPVIQVFPKGEEVGLEKDFFNYADEDMEGYAVTVLDAQLLPVKDFLKKFDAAEQAENLGNHTDYIYTVQVRIANQGNPHTDEKGISLVQYVLQGTDYILSFDDTCFFMANPTMPGASFSLRKGTAMDMILTFDVMSKVTSLDHLAEDMPKLLISQYPHQKMLEIV